MLRAHSHRLWVLLVDGLARAVGEGISVDVLGDQTFDVSRVARNVLLSDFVARPRDPCFRQSGGVSEDLFVFVQLMLKVGGVKPIFLVLEVSQTSH